MKNWKTTGSGILAIVTILWKIVTTQTVDPTDFAAVAAAVGLILAKDSTNE